ncbi:MAG: ctpA [Candidatus Adlerbacteria bacterium]|nr:ctpA [Candidatus Adlerbacteria bacterium]
MNSSKLKALGVFLVVALAFGFGMYAGVSERVSGLVSAQTVSGVQPANVDFAKFWQAWSLLQNNFVETHASSSVPSDNEKLYGAIKGLTESYGDPYTTFFPPVEAKQFAEAISGSFGGVGMEMGDKDGAIVVIAPLKNSPAERAGILTGDAVIMVDATSTAGLSVDDAVKLIRGPKGESVKLTLKRPGVDDPIVVNIVRDTISIPLIVSSDKNGVFTIELYSFSQNSGELFRQELRKFIQSGDSKLILDLRGNPGGYLEAAVQMASFFLPVGETVVTEDYKGKQENIVHRSLGYNVFAKKKISMVVLANQGSASASEILAGALQQHGVAKLVGTRTFGKGSVQQLLELGGGAELKVTVARWLTPNGTSISDGGLTPDIEAARTKEDVEAGRDPQMDAALKWLAKQ